MYPIISFFTISTKLNVHHQTISTEQKKKKFKGESIFINLKKKETFFLISLTKLYLDIRKLESKI